MMSDLVSAQIHGQSEAEQLFRRALAVTEALHGETHPETAITIDNLAQVLEEMGKFDEAELLFRRALAIAEATLEPENPSLAIVLNNLAIVLENKEKYEEATGLYERAFRIFDGALGSEHTYTREICRDLENCREIAQIARAGSDDPTPPAPSPGEHGGVEGNDHQWDKEKGSLIGAL